MSLEKHKVLVVDDELLIRDLLYDFFSGRECEIAVAASGQEALKQLEQHSFDVILVDLKMPDMDGLDLARAIRASGHTSPIILITGYPSVESAVEALRIRLYDYVTKPFNINQLFHLVSRAAREYREQGEKV